VLPLFLGNLRDAVVTASIIPMVISFLGMRLSGISAILMSLGAIGFGMTVAGAVVMIGNSVARLEEMDRNPLWNRCGRLRAVGTVDDLLAVATIMAVYLPIPLLRGLEARMSRPMAITVCAVVNSGPVELRASRASI
jgi:cobalt-zinc-cadmium resistance protein CzcA